MCTTPHSKTLNGKINLIKNIYGSLFPLFSQLKVTLRLSNTLVSICFYLYAYSLMQVRDACVPKKLDVLFGKTLSF